jgi:hypothetical protein
MGFLDNTSITVDAVLTKKGREILKNGGNLDIRNFTVTDTGVDYTLWNGDHPSGSAFYGEAIENLPMLEAPVHSKYSMTNRLVTLPKNVTQMPALDISTPDGDFLVVFKDGDAGVTKQVTVYLKGFAPSHHSSLLAIVETNNVVANIAGARLVKELDGIAQQYVEEAGIESARVFELPPSSQDGLMWNIGLTPDTSKADPGRITNITILEATIGAYGAFKVRNDLKDLHRPQRIQPQG